MKSLSWDGLCKVLSLNLGTFFVSKVGFELDVVGDRLYIHGDFHVRFVMYLSK